MPKQHKRIFILCALVLTCIGIVFIYSASNYWAKVQYPDAVPFYLKQIVYVVVALILATIVGRKSNWSSQFWRNSYFVSLLLLIAVLVPGIGLERNGSRSWIDLQLFTIQPAELAKITTLILLSEHLAKWKRGQSIVHWKHFAIIFTPVALIMLQPDFGSAFIIIISSFILLFIANYPLKFYLTVIFVSIISGIIAIISAPYRLKRITAFLDPWEDPLGSGFQAVQSTLAIGPAGWFGHGYLKSRQKYLYLPEPQNDFIFAIILEEVGFVGGFIIVCIFACFLYSGFQMAKGQLERSSFYIIASLVSMLTFQIALNIGVVVGVLPVTGVTLPFISYGGTSLILTWLVVGIIYAYGKGAIKK